MVGVAEPVLAGQPMSSSRWGSTPTSWWPTCGRRWASRLKGQFFSAADWQRARLEMWHADKLVRSGQPTANQWAAVQRGLDELLISPAVKRRAGIELRKHAADADEAEAVSLVGKYQQVLKSV